MTHEKQQKQDLVRTVLYLPRETRNRLDAKAEKERRTVSAQGAVLIEQAMGQERAASA